MRYTPDLRSHLNGSANDDAYGIARDTQRRIWAAGYTSSIGFPTSNPL